jgi:ABC-2 type transport system ATP-binding protein
VRLEAVGKRYGLGQPWVIRGVNRDVAAGQLIRLEGRNGSGKSTLLQVAAGVTMPSAGRVTGRPRVGFVPERFPGRLAFSARDYLGHMGRIHGLTGPAAARSVEEWLDRLGAAEYAASPLRTLSKGMCQKVAVAQALLPRPGLLVLDEAWTGLDQAARATLDAAVAERLADGGAVMFVDHDPARLAALVTERWLLAGGRVSMTAETAAPGGADGAGPAAGGSGAAADGQAAGVVSIEVTGVAGESAGWLGWLPGVLSVSPSPAPAVGSEAGLADEAGRQADEGGTGWPRPQAVRLAVAAADSDAVLRQLLARPGLHVAAVRPEGEDRP